MLWVNCQEQQRLPLIEEAFALQGWGLAGLGIELTGLHDTFSYRDGVGLAGAAFEAHCVCAAVLFAASFI